jgi:hypothetical protein
MFQPCREGGIVMVLGSIRTTMAAAFAFSI